MNGRGEQPTAVPITCVITRFGLRSSRHLLPTYLDYRRVVDEVARTGTPGLLRSAFLVENPTTCFTLSIWSGQDSTLLFGTNVLSHLTAARNVLGRLRTGQAGGPELWSTKWRLIGVSSNNLNWQDFDLRALIPMASPRFQRSG